MMITGAFDNVYRPIMVHTMAFLSKPTPKCLHNFRLQIPYQHWKWDAMLQGERSIAAWVFHSIPHMSWNGYRMFRKHIPAHYGPPCFIPIKNSIPISCKMSEHGYPLSMRNAMASYKRRESNCCLSVLRPSLYVYRWLEGLLIASMSHYDPQRVISVENNSQSSGKM